MSDLAARIKDLTERIESVNAEIDSVHEDGDAFQKLIEPDLERRRVELERELADLQGQVPAAGDTSLDFPDFSIPANAKVSGTYQVDDLGADVADLPEPTPPTDPFNDPALRAIERRYRDTISKLNDQTRPAPTEPAPETAGTAPAAGRPRTQEKPGTGAKDPQPERPPREERPRTQEKPGTGAKDPEPPAQERTGPTGQITDETGTYGPEQTWKPGRRDWNKVNRAGGKSGKSKGVPKVVYALGVVALLAVLIGTLFRPPSVGEPSGSIVQSGGVATPAPATTAPTAAPAAAVATPAPGPSAQTAAAAGYRCVGGQKTLFDNSNGSLVTSGGTPPTFSTNNNTYCLVSVSTYHWNGGRGATPGRIGLIGGSGSVGPVQTKSGTGVPNADWVYVPEADARPLLNGQYTCTDSDPASWSQNEASGRLGFCRVFVQDAVK